MLKGMLSFVFMGMAAYLLSGCAAKPLTHDEMKDYANVGELIEDNDNISSPTVALEEVFMGKPRIKTGPGYHPVTKVSAPIVTLQNYCANVSSGQWRKLTGYQLYRYAYPAFNKYGGLYGCFKDTDGMWYVELKTASVSKHWLDISVKEVDQKLADRSVKRQERALERKRREEERYRNSPRVQRFLAQASIPKRVGQQVCSPDNIFGYVTAVQGNRIQVQVKGAARTPAAYTKFDNFQFFKSGMFDYTYHEMNTVITANSSDWGVCNF